MNKQGGLPAAARYLARAVALPPSNTSWYMGLSNGAAGLCECLSSAIIYLCVGFHRISGMLCLWPVSSGSQMQKEHLDVNVQYRTSHVNWVPYRINCPVKLLRDPNCGVCDPSEEVGDCSSVRDR